MTLLRDGQSTRRALGSGPWPRRKRSRRAPLRRKPRGQVGIGQERKFGGVGGGHWGTRGARFQATRTGLRMLQTLIAEAWLNLWVSTCVHTVRAQACTYVCPCMCCGKKDVVMCEAGEKSRGWVRTSSVRYSNLPCPLLS